VIAAKGKTGLIFLHGAFGTSGGPEFILPQLRFLTSRGYFVKIVEYRNPPNLLDDVEQVKIKRQELIDEGCINIIPYGNSRGCWPAFWSMILHPELFAGIIAVAGPTNLVTLKAIPGGYSNYFIFKYDKKESSPVNYGSILGQKPLLLIYGKQDNLVPMGQGIELNKAVKESKFYLINANHSGVNSHPYTQAAILTWLKGI
jgi:pimeloyl-ACP methyl ester carboxylesterase